jgi:hypothetical protein
MVQNSTLQNGTVTKQQTLQNGTVLQKWYGTENVTSDTALT